MRSVSHITRAAEGGAWWRSLCPPPSKALVSHLLRPIRLPPTPRSYAYSSESSSSGQGGGEDPLQEDSRQSRGRRPQGGRGRAASRKAEEVRSWRRQLLLRVHPDLFQAPHHAQARTVNQRSLQAFQSLAALAGHSASSSSASFPLPPAVGDETLPLFSFHFFLRDEAAPPPPHSPVESGEKGERLKEVRYEFRPSPDIRRNPTRLRRAAEECMLHLFSLAGLIRPTSAQSAEQELPTADGWVMTDWSENALRAKAIEAIRFAPGEVKLSYQEELAAMLDPDMIFFDKLTHAQKMRAVETLTSNLERLGYAEWARIPLLVGKQYSRRAEGMVVIPYNFTVPRLVNYLNQHLPDIKREREHIRHDAHLIADLSHRLQHRLGLQDVSVWGSKRAAIGCLQRLTDIASLLASHDLSQASLILTDPPTGQQTADCERDAPDGEVGTLSKRSEATEAPQQEHGAEEERREQQFRYDARTRRLFVRKDFDKAALLSFLRHVSPRVEGPPTSALPVRPSTE